MGVTERVIHGARLVAKQGDLTAERVDVVVNAANEHLAHGGGLAAALVRAGGRVIQSESDAWVRTHGAVGRGRAAVTGAGDLPASHIVHVVGPRYSGSSEDEAWLRESVMAALDAASELDASTVALPAISTGIFGYPPDEACLAIATAASDWLQRNPGRLTEVRLVAFDERTALMFAAAIDESAAD